MPADSGPLPTQREDPWPVCPKCEGDGYTESWNDDQSDVVITLCWCPLGSANVDE